MRNTSRIWNKNFGLRFSTTKKNNWLVKTIKTSDNGVYRAFLLVKGNQIDITYPSYITESDSELTPHFPSLEALQNFIDNDERFVITSEARYNIVLSTRKDKVLTYSIERDDEGKEQILATWNSNKADTCFVVIRENIETFNLEEAHGKTLGEVDSMVEKAYDDSYDNMIGSYSDSYFALQANNGHDSENCSRCRGGGCPSCTPNF